MYGDISCLFSVLRSSDDHSAKRTEPFRRSSALDIFLTFLAGSCGSSFLWLRRPHRTGSLASKLVSGLVMSKSCLGSQLPPLEVVPDLCQTRGRGCSRLFLSVVKGAMWLLQHSLVPFLATSEYF